MKTRTGVLITLLVVMLSIIFISCATTKDPWGNPQTKKERKALNEIGCPGHQGMIGY
jgi:hypothetical protein